MRKFIVNVNGIDYNVEVREENIIESVKPAPVLAQSAPKVVVQQPPTPAGSSSGSCRETSSYSNCCRWI